MPNRNGFENPRETGLGIFEIFGLQVECDT